jgi:hypothetical protein
MMQAVEMSSGAMAYIPSFIRIGSGREGCSDSMETA